MTRAARSTTFSAPAVKDAAKRAAIPTRPIIGHTNLFRAELQAALSKANNALLSADNALSSAADDRDMAVSLANQKYEAIRVGVDAERSDIILNIEGIEAALVAINPAPANVVQISQAAE